MKFWMGPALLGLLVLPQWKSDLTRWRSDTFDTHIFECREQGALVVVSPHPQAAEHEDDHWWAQVDMRVGGISVSDTLEFRAARIDRHTVAFLQTAWGPEVHIFENKIEGGHTLRRRWWVSADGLKELYPVKSP